VAIGANQVGQHLDVHGVGLGSGQVVADAADAVAGHGQRVDRVDLIIRRDQRLDSQAPVGFDAHNDFAWLVGQAGRQLV
jgi:hypothetical protein